MNLDHIWNRFIQLLQADPLINKAYYKKVAGIPFLYLRAIGNPPDRLLDAAIRRSSATAMKGKQLHSETVFVRSDDQLFVYRHRFFVPQQKMFCCGNQCADCVLLKGQSYWT
ncbi:hypothetical protein CVD25_12765 [Bacillus canaveralius]|uniref:Uncharacterized protein n=1 Tax=Bacillus canaveralius TaxID=1403243 RepID=A0A2N5GNM3_9BACI|nr:MULTISPECIES: hypothetical protein [Bacillus]PLR84091.1 hypothetical protein CU635_07240 [Bacillus canaveralius]PLR87324.1 hypothetical protein CVD23_03715 [Bacillus sp. V33-4]PLR96263.1 hypothetical protein CVD25_12765 [Bacillus canaveralius]RSK53552.1 hypothetical protein EJA13_08245 [Bacillus canaveralius]